MGHAELLAALRRKGEEQADALRETAATREDALRADGAAHGKALREEFERRCDTACSERRHTIVAEAAREAALIRLRAEHELSLRLRERAGACLARLHREGGGDLAQLAGELPDAPWSTIRVAPADSLPARGLFPGAEVREDPAITGGLAASTADGSLTVVNTLESRLEKGWPDLLPRLVAELRGRPA
jgi:V/A-type H+-transporting ATPase subunit E